MGFEGFGPFGKMGTSVSRSEEETEEMVGDDCGGSMWFAGSNISLSLCVRERVRVIYELSRSVVM